MIEKKNQNKSPYSVLGIVKMAKPKEEDNKSDKTYEQNMLDNIKRKKEQEAYDKKIEDKTKRLLILKLGDIKKALKNNSEIFEDEEMLHNYMFSIITMLKSYSVIRDDEQRALFECSGITNIEDEAKSLFEGMEMSTLRKGKNAFEINSMQPTPLDKISNSDTRAKNIEIREAFKAHVLKLLTEIPDHEQIENAMEKITMSKVKEIIYRVEEQFWAYNKINNEAKRQQYMKSISIEAKRKFYKEISDDIKKENIMIRTKNGGPKFSRVSNQKPTSFTINKRENVTVQMIGKMEYEIFLLPEKDLGIYKISKSNGMETFVFSPINLDWITPKILKEKISIREGVSELFSDSSLKLSHEYLGGYLGLLPSEEIKRSDKLKIYADISACCAAQKKINERGKTERKKAGGDKKNDNKRKGKKTNQGRKTGFDFLERP